MNLSRRVSGMPRHKPGHPTTGGTAALRDHRPSQNTPVAQALFDAGALLFGKTSLHELAMGITNNNGVFGAVGNPYDPEMIPGGSSGGTGAAIGARIAPAGLGSDTGGSVRIPGLVIPAGRTEDGLPVGLEIDGPVLSDRRLLAIGLAIETLLPALPPPNAPG